MSKKSKEQAKTKKLDLRNKRELAKAGMAATMGGLILTGMMKQKRAHILSGVAFLGFAYWHTTLYAHNPNKQRLIDPLDGMAAGVARAGNATPDPIDAKESEQ